MKTEELFELVVMLTTKNMALEAEIKRLEKQTDRLVEDLNACNEDEEHDYYDRLASIEREAIIEQEINVLDEVERQDYEANCIHEKDVELNQKFNSINARLRGTNNRLTEFVHRVTDLEKQVSMFGLDHSELRYRVIELEEKEDNDGK